MKNKILSMDKKKRIILITICSVLLVLLLLFIFFAVANFGKKPGKNAVDGANRLNGVYILNGSLIEGNHHVIQERRCLEDNSICFEGIKFVYQGNKGHIVYTFYNYDENKLNGEVILTFGNYSCVIPYRNIPTGYETVRIYGYDGWDIDYGSITDYQISPGGVEEKNTIFDELPQADKDRIIAFYNPSD